MISFLGKNSSLPGAETRNIPLKVLSLEHHRFVQAIETRLENIQDRQLDKWPHTQKPNRQTSLSATKRLGIQLPSCLISIGHCSGKSIVPKVNDVLSDGSRQWCRPWISVALFAYIWKCCQKARSLIILPFNNVIHWQSIFLVRFPGKVMLLLSTTLTHDELTILCRILVLLYLYDNLHPRVEKIFKTNWQIGFCVVCCRGICRDDSRQWKKE